LGRGQKGGERCREFYGGKREKRGGGKMRAANRERRGNELRVHAHIGEAKEGLHPEREV